MQSDLAIQANQAMSCDRAPPVLLWRHRESADELVSQELAILLLLLILGTSMSGMQTWMWASQFPELMRAAIPIASFPEKVSGRTFCVEEC